MYAFNLIWELFRAFSQNRFSKLGWIEITMFQMRKIQRGIYKLLTIKTCTIYTTSNIIFFLIFNRLRIFTHIISIRYQNSFSILSLTIPEH